MGFNSVYRSLTEIFPQIDPRILRAVAIEHPKDADVAAALVLSDIIPSLPAISSHNATPSLNNSCQVASGSKSSASSSSSETVSLVVGCGHNGSAPSTEVVSDKNELTKLPLDVRRGVCHSDVENVDFQSCKKALGKEHEDNDFSEDYLAAYMFPTVLLGNANSANGIWQDHCFDMRWDQAESSTRINSESAAQKLVDSSPGLNMTHIQLSSCFDVGTGSINVEDEASKGSCVEVGTGSANVVEETPKVSLASENENAEVGGAFSSSTQTCSVDHLEEIIEDAKSNKKTLLSVMESVMNLMKEVELQEKDAEMSKEEAVRGGSDTLEKVEELKKMLEHAKEVNNTHAGEVYGEKSILATEVKELENRLFNLSEERNKSLAVLDEMRETLETRLVAALDMKKAAEQEKKEREDSALKALAEQEAMMEKVVQESKLLQQEAEENSKLREFLMAHGHVVDSLQGEISVICQDVKLFKEKFDNRVSLTKSISASQTSSHESSVSSLVLDNASEQLNGVLETSSNNNNKGQDKEQLNGVLETSSNNDKEEVKKEKDAYRELIEDGWEIFDKEMEL